MNNIESLDGNDNKSNESNFKSPKDQILLGLTQMAFLQAMAPEMSRDEFDGHFKEALQDVSAGIQTLSMDQTISQEEKAVEYQFVLSNLPKTEEQENKENLQTMVSFLRENKPIQEALQTELNNKWDDFIRHNLQLGAMLRLGDRIQKLTPQQQVDYLRQMDVATPEDREIIAQAWIAYYREKANELK